MAISRILIANRGEIAIRIARAAMELGLESVTVHSEDDATSPHVASGGGSAALDGVGVAPYLDIEQLVRIARETGCDALHPGYGFLSENPKLATACAAAGLIFIGPGAELLELCGNKARAREAARAADVPVLEGSSGAVSLEEAGEFFAGLPEGGAMVIKAVAGGGGRGMRVVVEADEIDNAYRRCRSEAGASFGNDAVYVERFMADARHIEVQVLADQDQVVHLGERDCSAQRRHQKIIEIAPSPDLDPALIGRITDAAVRIARHMNYRNIGTFEFLVDAEAGQFAFIEANARLQVEHTVTEAVTGVDIVGAQIQLAAGATLADLDLVEGRIPAPRGFAIQARVNMERMAPDGSVVPTGGKLEIFEPPTGPGVRVDTFGTGGYVTSPRFDSLLAKVICHSPRSSFAAALAKTRRALAEFHVSGVETNIRFLEALLVHPDFAAGGIATSWVDENAEALVATVGARMAAQAPGGDKVLAGAQIDHRDPLAVLDFGKEPVAVGGAAEPEPDYRSVAVAEGPPGTTALAAPLQGTVITVDVSEGDAVLAGQSLLVMESMKMEHEIRADVSGVVRSVGIDVGDTVFEGHPLVFIEPGEVDGELGERADEVDLDFIRPDLAEVEARHDKTLDASRPQAVARRRKTDQRTARENVEDLCDPGTFVEYGSLVVAAQRRRRTLEDLIDNTPADGMITGIGAINSDRFGDPDSRCVVMAYDYTVLAGTQGGQNHRKTDRMIDVSEQGRMPMVLFAEGGGGRPGDTDGIGVSTQTTFSRFAQLSALVPMVGITSGRCFAGNASLLGCCDVIIATENANIGMGGPAMIEGGGLGIYAPEEIGPLSVQVANGVVDVAVADEAAAVRVARQYLSYFQGNLAQWEAPDQRLMRRIVPENRLRVYEIRDVIDTIADTGSVLELRHGFGHTMVTALIRIEGRPVGVIANDPRHLGGAIDSDGADKGARFMQLCDAFDLPILYLCDTPGIMVGPQIEKTALVRHSSRMFVIGANLSVPFFTIVIRKSYGLGGIAMSGGSHHTPTFSVAWPTGEFGGMGLEGSVKLGYRKELAAIEDPEERLARFEEMVAKAYEHGKALNQASLFGIDDTIDPADSRWWVASLLRSLRTTPRQGKKRAAVDAW
jgi:acetyl/propionyl-CoA carboxylase alpha subunit/acetyl-CoA carboxylase carboxyltransferase component